MIPPTLIGLDLSPEMLACSRARSHGLVHDWRHAAAEATGLATASVDLVSLQFVCHELPQAATRAVLAEAFRLRPWRVAMVDQDPGSSVLQSLPAPVATLLKSTEPFIEQYFALDMPAALQEAGSESQHPVLRPTAPCDRLLTLSRRSNVDP